MAEDQQIIDFIVSHYHASTYKSTPLLPLASRSSQDLEPTSCNYLPPTGADHQTLPWDISAEQFRLYTSSLNLFSGEKPAGADVFFEGSTESFLTGKLLGLFSRRRSRWLPAWTPTAWSPARRTRRWRSGDTRELV